MRKIMRRSLTTSRMRGLLLGASAVAAVPLALATTTLPAAAQEDGQNKVFFGTLMEAIGLGEPTKPDISYRERAPLVVPPANATTGTLPAPQSAASARLPNWPKDPDVQRTKQANAVDTRPVMRFEDRRDNLLPSEYNKGGRVANANRLDGPAQRPEDRPERMMPNELGFKSWFGVGASDQKPLVFNGEPERESLTQPPVGYQTPAPNAPYGVVEKKQETFKFPTLFDRDNTANAK